MLVRPSYFVLGSLLAGCAPQESVVQSFAGPTMGSTYEVKFVGSTTVAQVRAIVEQELAAFDQAFSQWRTDSEIAKVNAHASTEPLPVSARFAEVLQLALDVAAATEGAFDPTVKPLSDLYRAAKRERHAIDAAAVEAVRPRIDHRLVRIERGAVVKAQADVALDLDGIVAGACADAIAARLAPLPLQGFYLDITGELLCRGDKGAAGPWRVGVEDPRPGPGGERVPFCTVRLRDAALCTSGGYRNGFVANGAVVHHVFDPRTGRNAEQVVASASVLCPSAAIADAFGTAFMVMGDAAVAKAWPRLAKFGLRGSLMLLPDGVAAGGMRAVEITWPKDDS